LKKQNNYEKRSYKKYTKQSFQSFAELNVNQLKINAFD